MRGKFITFEGGEGSGKSTQIKRLASYLEGLGKTVVCTREPGGTPGAEEIRALLLKGEVDKWDPIAETLLYFAARRDHAVRKIFPALEQGTWVLCDRFADSTLAYQYFGYGKKDITPEGVRTLYEFTLGAFKPDLTLILDVPIEEGLSRAVDVNRFERMGLEFLRRLRDGYARIAKDDPERCRVVSGSGSIEEVSARLRETLKTAFSL